MKIFSPVLKGTTVSDGTSNLSGSFTGSLFGTATTASNANTASYVVSSQTDTAQNTRLQTLESVTGSFALTSSFGAYTSSNDTTNTTQNARLLSNEQKTGSFATTGSNYFIGQQVITGSVYISSDLIVQGSSSLQNITASAVSIGTNTVILNTATPILQFGGISVQDSGSTMGRSGSLLWNSINDHWLNVNPSGSDEGYNSAMVINGPKNTGSLGQEVGLTTNYIPVSQGEDHITDSIIFQSGSTNIGIGTTVPAAKLDVIGSGRYSVTRTNGANANALILADTLTGISTAGFGTRIVGYSNGTGVQSVIGFENGGSGTNNESQLAFYTQNVAGALTKQLTIGSTGTATFSGSISATSATLSSNLIFTGSGGISFTSNDTNAYPRLTGADASAQLGLFRSGGNAGGVYLGGSGTQFTIYNATFGSALMALTQAGNATFSGSVAATSFGASGQISTSNGVDTDLLITITATGAATKYASIQSSVSNRNLVLNPTNGGYVGIGVTNPTHNLEIRNSAGSVYQKLNADFGIAYVGMETADDSFRLVTAQATPIQLYTNNTERMRITAGTGTDVVIGLAAGNPYTAASRGSIFLNGTTNSLYGWGTGGTARGYMYHEGTNIYMENSVSGGTFNIIQVGAGNINFSTNGATRMTIQSNGAIITGRTLGNQYSQTSSTGTTSIVDTGITYDTGDYGGYGRGTTYQVVFNGNPNAGGSGAYFAQHMGIITIYTGWSGSAVTTYINYTQLAVGNNISTLTLTPHFWNGSSQVSSIGVYTTGYQIRLRIDGYNSSYVGSDQSVYLTRLT